MINKRYFKYLALENRKVFFIISLLIALTFFITNTFLSIGYVTIGLSMISSLYFLTYIHSKGESELMNSLPLTKKTIWKTRLFFSIAIVSALILSYAVWLLILGWLIDGSVIVKGLVIVIPLLLVMNFVNQIIFAWIIEKCRNSVDSILAIIIFSFLPYLIMNTAGYFIGMNTYVLELSEFIPDRTLSSMGSFMYAIEKLTDYPQNFNYMTQIKIQFVSITCWLIVAVLAYGNTIRNIERRGSEEANKKTTNIFIFPLSILVVTTLCLFTTVVSREYLLVGLLMNMFVFIAYMIAFCFYTRKFSINKKLIVIFLGLLLSVNIFRYVFIQTQGFGIEEYLLTRWNFVDVMIEKKNPNTGYTTEYWTGTVTDPEIIREVRLEIKSVLNDFYGEDGEFGINQYTLSELPILTYGFSKKSDTHIITNLNMERFDELVALMESKGYKKNLLDYRYK